MKNFTNNFKQFTSRLSARWLIIALMLLLGTSSAWASGSASGPAGVYLEVDGTASWYNIHHTDWGYSPCSGWDFKSADKIGNDITDFGTLESFKLKGFGLIGWCDKGDWVSGQLRYQINSGSYVYYKVCNYGDCNSGVYDGHVACSSNNDRVVGYKDSDVDLLDGLAPGPHTIKFKAYGQNLWKNNGCGDFNSVDHSEKSATFTIPGYSTTTGDKDFGEVDVNSSSDYTVELTHYGSDNTATVSITGTNKSEFTATVTESGDNTQKLTVTFKPTSVAPDKTATIKVTDAYNKTYTLTVTGTGKQSCQAPTSVSVTGSETPCVGANETYTADIVGGSKYDLEWAVPDGYTIIEGQGTTSIIVEVGTTSGNITCTATCGNAAPSDEISVAPYTTVAPTINLSAEYVCPDESATITVESPELNVEGLSYKLYNKNDTSTPIAIITEPKTEPVAFTIQEGTYYVTVSHTCGGEKKSTNEKTLQEYQAPAMPAYTPTPATSCKRTPNSDGTITLKNPMGGVTYALDGTNDTEWSDLAAGTHTLSALVDACPSLTREWDIEVGEEDITPSATVTISGDVSFCEGGNTVLTCNVTDKKGNITDYQWYNGEELIQGATASTYTANAAGNYKVVVTVNNNDCVDTFEATIEVSVKNKPTTPAFNPNFTSICVGGSTTLASGYSWYTDLNASALANLTVSPQTETTYYAIKEENGCTSDAGTFTVKVNPLPRITAISVNNSTPVINEDVLLTVEGSDIARVEWSITSEDNASLSDASGNSVKLTSTASGAVTVTATAISSNGCRATSTKEVTFSETEDCTGNISNDIQIIFYHPSTYNEYNSQKGQWWGMGTMYYSTDKKSWLTKDMGDATSGSKTVTIQNITSEKLYVYFESKWTYHVSNKASTKEDIEELTRGNRYDIRITSHGNDNVKATSEATYTGSLSTPAPLSAPAVKTVSATSEEGSGIVTFTGKVLKTGCANGDAIWVGYQYKKANEEWPTSDVTAGSKEKQLVLISNNPGSEDFTAEVNVENLDDGDYHFRAYIINGYNFTNGNYDQGVYYGLDKQVTVRNTKTAIISVALQHADEYGNPILPTPTYCAGTTAYLLLTYEGSRPDVVNWSSTLSNTITKVDGDLYQFTVAGSETITVSAKNEENIDFIQGTIEVAAYSIPLTPMVELDKSEICSNDEDGATITVTNAQDGIQYYLYETGDDEAVQGPITGIGSLAFTKIKTAATYYVSAVNSNCLTYKVESQKRAITMIDASQNTIAIEPTTKTINPWGTVTLNVTKNSQYDYTLKCMQEDTDVTANLVINKKGDTYSIKFPKPSTANIVDGQVTFSDIIYIVTVTLDGSVQCGTTSATSEITLTQLVEDCD